MEKWSTSMNQTQKKCEKCIIACIYSVNSKFNCIFYKNYWTAGSRFSYINLATWNLTLWSNKDGNVVYSADIQLSFIFRFCWNANWKFEFQALVNRLVPEGYLHKNTFPPPLFLQLEMTSAWVLLFPQYFRCLGKGCCKSRTQRNKSGFVEYENTEEACGVGAMYLVSLEFHFHKITKQSISNNRPDGLCFTDCTDSLLRCSQQLYFLNGKDITAPTMNRHCLLLHVLNLSGDSYFLLQYLHRAWHLQGNFIILRNLFRQPYISGHFFLQEAL